MTISRPEWPRDLVTTLMSASFGLAHLDLEPRGPHPGVAHLALSQPKPPAGEFSRVLTHLGVGEAEN